MSRIYVDVCALEGGDWRRVKAEVNTCSSRSLVTRNLVAEMRLQVSPASASIVTVDGSPLEIAGSVMLRVVWQDDAGRLKEKSSRLLVVIDMSSVKTDVTIGHDFISERGGIDLQYDANVLATVISGHDRGMSACFYGNPCTRGRTTHTSPEACVDLHQGQRRCHTENRRRHSALGCWRKF